MSTLEVADDEDIWHSLCQVDVKACSRQSDSKRACEVSNSIQLMQRSCCLEQFNRLYTY